jgi:hypothetical protein
MYVCMYARVYIFMLVHLNDIDGIFTFNI